MQPSRTPATVLALFFMVVMLAALGLRFWAVTKGSIISGPTHIAAAGDDVYVHAAENLYHLTAGGALVQVVPPDRSGLKDIPIDLRVLDDGSLLVAEQQPASIRLCRLTPWQCRPLDLPVASRVRAQFKVLYAPGEHEMFLTDAKGDMLWKMADGSQPEKAVADRTLAGPNDLAFDVTGNLWVADTDHRRIVELTRQRKGELRPGREYSALNRLTIGKRYYPMMLALAPDDRWWVIQASDFSDALADIVIYDADEGAQAVIDLPAGAYPTDIASLGRTMLVTDPERLAVYRIDTGTLSVSEFGNEAFRLHLKKIGENRKYYRGLSYGSLAGVVISAALMLLAAFLAAPANKRWTEIPGGLDLQRAPEHVPDTKGVHWLELDPRSARAVKWMGPLSYVPLIAGIAGAFVLYLWVAAHAGASQDREVASQLNQLGLILLLCVPTVVLAILVVHFQLRNLKQKVGTDGKHLLIRLTDGRELSVEPHRLFYTKRAILYRQYTFPLVGAKQKPLYRAGEVETWLGPLLRQAGKLTLIEALRYRWKNRDDLLLWSAVAMIMMMLALIVLAAIVP